MTDKNKTKDELIKELNSLRRKLKRIESGATTGLQASGTSENDRLMYRTTTDRDITGRDKSQSVLKASEEQLYFAYDAISDGICLIDVNRKIISCNSGMCRLLGKSVEKIVGKTCCELMNNSIEPIKNCPFLTMCTTKQRETLEVAFKNRWLNEIAHPVIDESGMITGAVHIFSDITEQKRNALELQAANDELDNIFNLTPDMICTVSSVDGIMSKVNRTFHLTMGYSIEEIQRVPFIDFVHPDDRKKTMAVFENQRINESVLRFENRFRKKDGSYRWFAWQLKAVGENGLIYCAGRDVTKQRMAEEKLKQNEELLYSFMNSATDSFVLLDEALNFIECNTAAQKFWGLTKEQIIGKNIVDLIPDIKETGRYFIYKRVIKSGKPFFIDDITTYKSQELHYSLRAFKVGNGLGIIAVDITDHTKKDRELQDKNVALREVVAQVESEKDKIKKNITSNLQELVFPILDKIKIETDNSPLFSILEKNLHMLSSKFGRMIGAKNINFSPREIEICNYIRNGLTSKEIAAILKTSPQTVEKQRKRIRKKMGITDKSTNLVSILRVM